jgi:DNA recombination protein RmuC
MTKPLFFSQLPVLWQIVIIGLGSLCALLFVLWLIQKKNDLVLMLENQALKTKIADHAESYEEKIELIRSSKEELEQAFEALSSKVLQKNSQSFLQLAKTSFDTLHTKARGDLGELIAPMKKTLDRFDTKVDTLEKARVGAYASLKEQIVSMQETQKNLAHETSNLSSALRAPQVRGRWGEMQLRRVVEMAGMQERCDFIEQSTLQEGERRLRPDLIIRMPGGRSIAVDAKTPLEAYLQAQEAETPERQKELLFQHARAVRSHILELSKKSYAEALDEGVEFVVLFLPAEAFFSSALNADPTLIEQGLERGVMLSTPTTLIALLRSVAYGWKQESMSKHAEEISQIGHELYKRLSDLGKHWGRLGKQLMQTVKTFNQATGSLESRVLPTARKFESLGIEAHQKELSELEPIAETARVLSAPEVLSEDEEFVE